MDLIPKFSAMNWRANCLLDRQLDLEELKNTSQEYADLVNTYPHLSFHPPIDSGNIYSDFYGTILLGQTKEQAFENYFQIKEIKFSWSLNGMWEGINRPNTEGWNGSHQIQNQNSVTYFVGVKENGENKYILPPDRCCEIAFNEPRVDQSDSNWRTERGFLLTTGYEQRSNILHTPKDFGDRGFGLYLNLSMIIFIGVFPVYNQTLHFGNNGFYAGTFQYINGYIHKIPLRIIDRGITHHGFVCASLPSAGDVGFASYDGHLEIEIIRYEFEE